MLRVDNLENKTMILMESAPNNLYLHHARQFDGRPAYVLVYGLEVTRFASRANAVRGFARCLDHAEECETGERPIFSEQ